MTIKVRYSDFTTVTRSQSTREPTADVENIVARALRLLEKTEAGHRPIRLLGVSVHNFGRDEEEEQAAEKTSGRLPSGYPGTMAQPDSAGLATPDGP